MSSVTPEDNSSSVRNLIIGSGVDISRDHGDYPWMARLSREEIVSRWESDYGKQIISRWRGNNYSRETLDTLVGRFNGKTDIRGIQITYEKLENIDLSDCDMFSANLSSSTFKFCNLSESYLSECKIQGTKFNYCRMKDVLIDNTLFDRKTSIIGVDLDKINFNLAWSLRSQSIAQQKIFDFEERYRLFAFFLRITCDYGRSFQRFFLWCLGVILLFAFLFSIPGTLEISGFWNGLYTSITLFSTIGHEYATASVLGRTLVALESCFGYAMGSLLVALLARRMIVD